MNCCCSKHAHRPIPAEWPVKAMLRVAEGRLAARTIGRHKRRILAPVEARELRDLRRVFRLELARVLDLLGRAKLPYTPNTGGAFNGAVAEAVDPAAMMAADELLELLLNGQNLTAYTAGLGDLYRDVMPAAMDQAAYEAMAARGIGITGKLTRFPRAERWITDHAIQFGDEFAKSVTATTNDAIRRQLAQGMAGFESTDDLAKRVRAVYDAAGKKRAEMIVRTELNRAYSSASHEAYRELGVDGKFWIISGSEYAVLPEVCAVNADMGTIRMGESFDDVDGSPIDAPPAHPNCLCDLGIDIQPDWEPPDWLEEV